MSIQEDLHRELVFAIKAQDEKKKETLRVALAELSREREKQVADSDTVRILKKLIASEREMGGKKDPDYIEQLEHYLPQQASDEEIEEWVRTRIDFSNYKSPIQAMREVMQAFDGLADGNRIKDILLKISQESKSE